MSSPPSETSIPFFDSTYEEALALAREARDYMIHKAPVERQELPPEARLVASSESLRITARLTQVMAWLFVQRAVHAGEMTRAEAAKPEHRLGGQAVCDTEEAAGDARLPPSLSDLLQRSLRLYRRVARLDALHDQEKPQPQQ